MYNDVIFDLNTVPNFLKTLNESHSNTFIFQEFYYDDDKRKKYKVVQYDKSYIVHEAHKSIGLIKSIICNNDNNVICFSPPKTLKYETFKDQHQDDKSFQNIEQQEFVEGLMVNLFWDSCIGLCGSWEISTRDNVGAKSNIVKGTSVRDAFLETLQKNTLSFDNFDKHFCYSFVLQYPTLSCNIVNPYTCPRLFLIKVYHIQTQHDTKNKISSVRVNDITKRELNKFNHVAYKKYSFKSFQHIETHYNNQLLPYHNMGIVLYNCVTGVSTKIKNPVYQFVLQKTCYNDSLTFQYLYFELLKKENVNDYLKKHPHHNNEFWYYRQEYLKFRNAVFNNYISCFVKKEKRIEQFPLHIRIHMIKLHNIYTNSLQTKRKVIKLSTVDDYFKEIETTLLVYTMNYPSHCRYKDKLNNQISLSI